MITTFKEYIEKRFLTEEGPPGGGIGAPGALPGGPPGMGGPLGGGPPGMGGPPGGGLPGMGPPGGPGGAPPGGGDLAGKKPLVLNSLNVWETLKKIFGMDSEEKTPQIPEKQKPLQHLQS